MHDVTGPYGDGSVATLWSIGDRYYENAPETTKEKGRRNGYESIEPISRDASESDPQLECISCSSRVDVAHDVRGRLPTLCAYESERASRES